jgi:diguanylate cyclase (GGDEF)-like protein
LTDTIVVPEYREVTIAYLDEYNRAIHLDPQLAFIGRYRLRPGVAELESYVQRRGPILFRDEAWLDLVRRHIEIDVSGLKQQFDRHSVVGVLEAIRAELIGRLNDGGGAKRVTGGLAGLPSRDDLARALEGLRDSEVIALVFIDLDGFKALNDTGGHAAGDACLERIADTLVAVAADRGATYRYGGDEFALVLRNATCDEAATTAERVRKRVEAEEQRRGTGVTTSIGVASTDTTTLEALVSAADEAMYGAKATGKNRVVCHPLTEMTRAALLSFRSSGRRDR